MITVEGLGFSYGEKPVLEDVSLCAEGGTFTAVIGPNGSGKTTLLRLISGYLRPHKGQIWAMGRAVEGMSVRDLARQMAFVPGTLTNQFDFTAYETVLTGRNPYIPAFQKEGPADREKARAAMERLEVWDLRDAVASNLSAGERQRVASARALCQDTPILLMDEPVSNLDIRHKGRALQVAKDLSREGKCVVSVLHDMDLAAVFADAVIIMKAGRVFAAGPTREVLTEENIQAAFEVSAQVEMEDGVPRVLIRY